MKDEQVSRIIGNIDEKYISEATMFAYENGQAEGGQTAEQAGGGNKAAGAPSSWRHIRINPAIFAAAAIIVILLGTTAYAITAEAKEYKAAVTFFTENGLSTEGLSRAEVKAVYRDITTKSFTYGKTAEVLQKTVAGYEIDQEKPDPEELAELWRNNERERRIDQTGISFTFEFGNDPDKGTDTPFAATIISCFNKGVLLWTAEFPGEYYHKCVGTGNGTVVIGGVDDENNIRKPAVAFLDADGLVLWKKIFDHGIDHEYISNILPLENGSFVYFTYANIESQGHLGFGRIDVSGNETFYRSILLGENSIGASAKLGDGFLVQEVSWGEAATPHILRLDNEGTILGEYNYTADDQLYNIQDMIEFGGKVFLSAYAVPVKDGLKYDEELRNYLRTMLNELTPAAQSSISESTVFVKDDKLTEFFRANNAAVLIVCDPENAYPEVFYSVNASRGGALSVNEAGQLEWEVDVIGTVGYNSMIVYGGGRFIFGQCKEYKYLFKENGVLTERTDTGKTVELVMN